MERKKMTEGMSPTQKLAYYWYYYKWFVIVAIFVAIVMIVGIRQIVQQSKKDYLMSVIMVNDDSYKVDESDYFDRFLKEYKYDSNVQLNIDGGYDLDFEGGQAVDISAVQILAAMFVNGDVDIFVSDQAVFDAECERNGFTDLRQLIPEEELEVLGDLVYYGVDADGDTKPYGIYLTGSDMVGSEQFFLEEQMPVAGVGSQSRTETRDLVNMLYYMISRK